MQRRFFCFMGNKFELSREQEATVGYIGRRLEATKTRLSRRAQHDILSAIHAGVSEEVVITNVMMAITEAKKSGKSKVGNFGRTEKRLRPIRRELDAMKKNQQMSKPLKTSKSY